MKPTFAKLGLKINNNIKTILINNQEVEVKQYLPINEKLDLISSVINQAADENNFANPIKLSVFTNLEIIFRYSNITFTDKQKEDLIKLYDICESNRLFTVIIDAIPEEEYNSLIDGINECANSIYNYRNSVYGIIETIVNDYNGLNLDASAIQEKLSDPDNLALLKGIMTKLG